MAIPPFSTWVEGAEAVRQFYQLPVFEAVWSKGMLGTLTHANEQPAIAWFLGTPEGKFGRHSLEVLRFDGESIAESIHFVGSHYLRGFDVPDGRQRE